MKVTSYAVARPNYYDRGATGTSVRYSQSGIAPHAQTTRWTVTVASGQKAFVEFVGLRVAPGTVATTFSIVEAGVETSAGGVITTLSYIRFTSSAALTVVFTFTPTVVSLFAADTLVGFTSDYSTGGTNAFIVDGKLTTFTA